MSTLFGGNNSVTATIGGIAIGSAGTGIRSGFTLSGGDDFTSALSVVGPVTQSAKYFCTRPQRVVGGWPNNNARSRSDQVKEYHCDPYHTGYLDANRGVAPSWGDCITQANSNLVLKARIATTAEKLLFDNVNPESIANGMIHTGGYMLAQPPFIVEYRAQVTSTAANGAGLGWSGWMLTGSPMGNQSGWEIDFESNPVTGGGITDTSWNQWSGGANIANGNTGVNTTIGTNYRTYTWVVTASDVTYFIDGVQIGSPIAIDFTLYGNRPLYLLLEPEVWVGTYNGTTWTSLGNTGVPVNVDWFRMWRSSSNVHRVPLVSQANITVDFNTAFTANLPNATTVWGTPSITDVVEMIQAEAIDPSGQGQKSTSTNMPAGVTYSGGVLSGTIVDRPGAIYFSRSGTNPGETCQPQRFVVNVGPTITTSQQNLNNGNVYSHDLYTECPVGSLLPKVITVGTLPTGLTFDGVSTISGTPTVNGTTSVPITVTNVLGQAKTTNVNFVVAANAMTIDGTNSNSATTQAVGVALTTTLTNDVIIVVVKNTTGQGIVSSMTDNGPGLTWTKYAGTRWGSTNTGDLELWYAVSPLAFNATITAHMQNNASQTTRVTAFGVNNANTTTPFDVNASLPGVKNDNSGTAVSLAPASAISTTGTTGMLIATLAVPSNVTGLTEPTGFSQISQVNASYDICYKTYSSAQSSISPTYNWTGAMNAAGLWVAIQHA